MDLFKTLDLVDNNYGGKALGLKKLILAGVNVPKGISISASDLSRIIKHLSSEDMDKLISYFDVNDLLAVRSSALNEDGSQQSFAGQYESVLNVHNNATALKQAFKIVYDSSLSKEIQIYSGNQQDSMGIVIQKMINPQYSGVLFTEATDLNGETCCLIEVVEGLGDKLVSGHAKTTRIIIPYDNNFLLNVLDARIEGNIQNKTIIDNLLESIKKINMYFKNGMDVEWCIDNNGVAYMLQARPITRCILIPKLNKQNGIIASIGECKGKSFVIDSDLDDDELIPLINAFPNGSILIAPFTDTQYMPAINKAIGIITEEGSILSHAAIIAREKGLPCVVAFKDASKIFPTGTEISLNTATGKIYSQNFSTECEKKDIDWESIYIFDNVKEINTVDGCKIIIEYSPLNKEDFVIHIPYDLNSNQYISIEYYFRKKYHKPANFLASEKYLWFKEYERFSNFDIFNHYIALSKSICEEQNTNKLEKLYANIMDDVKLFISLKQTQPNNYELFKIEETLASLHLIADSIIPDGYGLLSVYKKISSYKNMKFKDFLNGKFDHTNTDLKNCFIFFNDLSQYRNTICQKFVNIGAYSFNYFDDREDRANLAINKKTENPVTTFYEQLKLKKINNINTDYKSK